MKEMKFKTNINCGGCIASVTPHLNQIEGINWKVDTENPDKILTVDSDKVSEQEIIEAVKKAGFQINVA
ncbi:heavy-metal-associated domain-containing protein [Moheibacter sediminis]|uniref:Copper chaperone CopZ n=1 Tax=Moheibacter sediminis TaxID=1434700 RepID=A0A1W2AVN7_9FLAO|nr:heavy-metal-associated domain-containing protein [Moheibacter sediminis]SMC64552.1 Copper chaperone CopZ [Moheibacter sediminis]